MNDYKRHVKILRILGIVAISFFSMQVLINIYLDVISLGGLDPISLLNAVLGMLYNIIIDVGLLILLIVGVVTQQRRFHTLNNYIIVWIYVRFFELMFMTFNTYSILFTLPPPDYQIYIIWQALPGSVMTLVLFVVIVYVHTFKRKWPAKILIAYTLLLTMISVSIIIRNQIIYGLNIVELLHILLYLGFYSTSLLLFSQGQHMVDWQRIYLKREAGETVFGNKYKKKYK